MGFKVMSLKKLARLGSCIAIFSFCFSVQAAPATEEELDAQYGNTNNSKASENNVDKVQNDMKFKVNGYVENEAFFNVPAKESTTEGNIAKFESHLNLITRYGSEHFFFLSEIDAFYYPERGALSKDNPHENRSIELQELYLSAGDSVRFKMGKMRVDHSTADAFSVINFMAQRDMREIFGIRKNARDRGIYAVGLKGIAGDFMAEGIISPMHNPPLYPSASSFMAIKPLPIKVNHPLLTGTVLDLSPQLQTNTELDSGLRHTSAVLRAGGNAAGIDFHLIYFNGIDQSLFFRPTTSIDWAGDPTKSGIVLEPMYNKVETYGMDVAWAYKKFSMRLEGAYTPAKWLVYKTETDNTTELGVKIVTKNKVNREQFIAYTVGFDLKLYSDESILLAEFTQSQPLKNKGAYYQEFLTEMLLVRIEDKFLQNRLSLSLGGVIRPMEKNPGFVSLFQAGWDFENGLELLAGATIFTGKEDDILKPFEDKDFFYTNVKMSF